MKKILTPVLLLLMLAAAGCASHRSAAVAQEEPELDRETVWQLVGMRQKEVDIDGTPLSLQFNPETHNISGFSGCNRYFGEYREDGRSIVFQNVGCTRMACPDAEMKIESAYLPLLEKVTRYELTRYRLTLYQKDRVVLEFEVME